MNLLPYLSKYGIGVEYDENDNVVTYDLKTRARLSQEETAKRIKPETTTSTTVTPNTPVAPVNPIAPTIDSPLTKIYKKQFKRG
jgi:hypothetical protein